MRHDRQMETAFDLIRADHRHRYEMAARYATGRVLDAACGCGYGTKFLHDLMPTQAVGVDIHAGAIDWANRHFAGPEYICGRIEDAPWTGKFDTIVTLETLEHLEHPDLALAAFRRSLEGTLIASVPNESSMPFVAERFGDDEYPHRRHYTPDEFDDLLRTAGFHVRERFCQAAKKGAVVEGIDGDFLFYLAE